MKKSTISILLLFVMILSISVAFAADENVTSDLGQSQTIDEAVEISTDDSADSVVMDATAVDTVEPNKTVLSNANTEILADPGDKNFTQLQYEIDNAQYGMINLNSNYVRQDGENDIVITNGINIFGQNGYKIDANDLGGIFKINDGCTVLLQDVILVNGNADKGGAIYNEGTLALISSQISDCNGKEGGAIYNTGILSISGSTLDGNIAIEKGGAVYSKGTAIISSSTFANNEVTKKGGSYGGAAVFNAYGADKLSISNSNFINNLALWSGSTGAVTSWASENVTIRNSYFERNVARWGGAVEFENLNQESVAINNCTFYNNTGYQGGAVCINDGAKYVNITGSTFEANKYQGPAGAPTTGANGAAISVGLNVPVTLEIANSIIKDNVGDASEHSAGVGIRLADYATGIVTNCTFENNGNGHGSDINVGTFNEKAGGLTVKDSTFINSKADENIMVFINPNIQASIENCTFENNGNNYTIANQGTLALKNNTIGGTVSNVGTITTQVNVTVLNNDTITTFDGEVKLNATVTDADGNALFDDSFKFLINGEQIDADYDAVRGYYNATYTLPGPGIYPVSAVSTKDENYAVKKGTIKNIKGTYTDLVAKIADAVENHSSVLELPYDFKYTPELGDDVYVNGITISKTTISSPLTIIGNSHTISGNDLAGIFKVLGDVTFTLVNATLCHGNSTDGGAIYAIGQGDPTIKYPTLNIINCTFTENIATEDNGGAIYTTGALIVDNCTFTNNVAPGEGGAIYLANQRDSSNTINNSKFENNIANGTSNAIRISAGVVELENNTINTTYAEIVVDSYGKISTPIYAKVLNGDTVYVDVPEVKLNAIVYDNKGNLIKGKFKFKVDTTIVDDTVYNSTTQSYEAVYTLPGLGYYTVNMTSDIVDVDKFITDVAVIDYAPGTFTRLQNLINAADGELTLTSNYVYNATFDGNSFPTGIIITDDIIINGNGYTISANSTSMNIFRIPNGVTATLNNTILTGVNGSSSLNAGAVINLGNLTIDNCTFIDNAINKVSPANGGAAVFSVGTANLLITDSKFINNTAPWEGSTGAVSFWSTGTVLIKDSYFERNVARFGGAVEFERVNQKSVAIDNCTFYNNTGYQGGAVDVNDGAKYVNITGSTFDSNNMKGPAGIPTTGAAGGAICAGYNSIMTVEITDCIIKNNYGDDSTPSSGAGIRLTNYASGIIKNCTFENNYGANYSAISVGTYDELPANLTVDNCTFIGNPAPNSISVFANKNVNSVIENCDFSQDTNDIAIANAGNLSLNNNIISTSAKIINVGTITSTVYAVVLDNGTYETYGDYYKLNATLTDKNGNPIYDSSLKFKVNGVELDLINYTNGIYTYDAYPIVFEPEYVVNVTSDGENKLSVKTGTIKNLKSGTYTDLINKINDTPVNGILVLPYDFKYNIEIDGLYNAIVIDKNITIDGNGSTLDAVMQNGFFINKTAVVTIKNLTIVNVMSYAIENNGTLTLNNNTISTEKALIINNGTITNAVVKVLGNDTVNIKVSQPFNLNATFTDDQGNLVYDKDLAFTVDGRTYPISSTYKDGLYTAPYTAEEVGLRVVNVIDIGDTAISTGLLKINAADVNLTIVANETIDRKQKETVTVKLADEWGNPLSFAVTVFVTNGTGQEVHRETITTENGNYTFELPSFAIGSYTITAMFSGNTNYNPKITNAQFEVTEVDVTGTFTQVQLLINESEAGAIIVIPNDIIYNPYVDDDYDYTNGIIINKNITIDGNGTTIDANKTYRIFTIAEGVTVTIANLTMKNGKADDKGAAILTSAKDLTLSACNLIGNDPVCGGALYIAEGNVTVIENTLFENNTADFGGAIFVEDGAKLTVNGATFKNNTADLGGAIYVRSADNESVLTVNNANFIENKATKSSGAILINDGYKVTYSIADSLFESNSAIYPDPIDPDDDWTVDAGAIYVGTNSSGAIYNSIFRNNKAKDDYWSNGGAVKISMGATITISDSTFEENEAGYTGGAIDIQAWEDQDNDVTIDNCTFTANTAGAAGGAIAIVQYGGITNLTIKDSRFTANTAQANYQAIYIHTDTNVEIINSNFTNNGADNEFAINNLGTLALSGNNISNIIYNRGTITTDVTARILENNTYDIIANTYELTATLKDESGNDIYDPNLKFKVNDDEFAAEYNATTRVYNYTYTLTGERLYTVNATSVLTYNNLIAETSVLRNITGTYTDLQNLIDAADDTLVLPYDFAYVEAIDGDSFPNGVVINKAITIEGNEHTISGNNSYRIFMVKDETTLNNITFVNGSAVEFGGAIYAVADLTVANSTFDNNAVAQNDANGGAIAAVAAVDDVTLTINNVDFTNNKVDNGGAAVAVAGVNGKKLTYNIYDSLFENNVAETALDGNAAGGAIFSYGATNGLINNTVFKNNTALTGDVANGGAIKIQFGGTLTVANSTFEDNKAGLYGGAIAVQAADGIGNTLTVDNCTFSGNNATYGDAIGSRQYYDESIVKITGSNFDEEHAVYLDEFTNTLISDSNFTGDRYPIINFGTLTLSNNSVYKGIIYNGGLITTPVNSTILNNVTHDTVDDSYNLYATLRDLDGNDIYDPNFTFTVNGVTLDVVPDYDPVIGLYNVTYVFTDERVNVIDAVSPNEGILNTEYGILRNIKGTYTDLQNKIYGSDGELVLKYNFTYTEEIDYKYFDPVDYVEGYFNDGVIIADPIKINGNGYTISGNNTKRIFNVTADFELTNATLTKGNAEDGGAIYVSDKYGAVNLDVSKSTFTANIVSDAGGAIAIDATNGNGIAYNIFDSVFENNYAVALDTCVAGGAVYTEGNAKGAIIGSNFTKNAAESMYRANGGAVKVQFGGDATIRDCTFTDNVAGLNGGAISIQANTGMDNKVIIDGCTFTDNGAGSAGGAISALQGVGKSEVTITDSKFTGNKVADAGGAIYFDDLSTVSVEGSNFTDNVANKGGAIYALNSLPVTGSKFKGNVAKEAGGAIYVSDKYVAMGLVAVKDSTFVENTACNAGGAIAIDATNGNKIYYLINGSEFTNNSIACDGDCDAVAGGAVYTEGNATGAIIGSNFTENKAMAEGVPSNGGAVKVQFGGSSYIINSTFKENVAQKGAAIDLQANTGMNNMVIVSGCTFTENKATQAGGAIASLQNVGNSTLIVMNSEFKENQAELVGGAIYLDDLSLVYVNGSTFDNNGAAKGGAIYALGNLTVNASNFKANKAEDEGAAIYISNAYGAAELTVNGCNFTDNVAAKGGAVVSKDAEGVINGSYFSNNGKDLKVFNINNPGNLTVTNNVFDVSSITIKTDKDVYIYGENVNVFGDFYWGVNNPAINVTIVLTKDGSYCGNVTTELNEFQFNETLDGEGLVPGSYIATMNQFTEDAYGNVFKVPSSIGTAFVIAKANATINVTVGDNKRFDYVVDGTNVTLYLELLSNVTGKGITSNVNVVVNDTAFPVEIVNGTAVVNVTVFTPGVYAVVAEFAGNEYYNGSIYASDVFTLLNPYRTLSIDVNDTIFGVPALVTITVKDYAGNLTDGIVELAINGTAALIPVNGTLIVPITDLAIGEYLINATLMPTDLDAPIVNDTETFAVGKAPTSVEITGVWNVTYPEGVFVLYEVGNETDVTIAVSQNGTLVSPIIDSSIKGSLIIYGLSAGVYTINITNAENDNYTGSSDSALFEISKAAPVIEVSAVDVTYPDDVVVTVVSNAAGEVTVIVGGKNATETVEAGVAKNVTISGLAANEEGYGIFVELAETANYTSGVNDTEIVKVMKAASNVVIDDIADVIYHDVVEVTYTVDNKTDVTVVVKYANGTEVTTGVNTTVDGKVLISGLTAGGYTITIANAGDANHTDFTAEAKFNVLKDTVVIEPNATGDFVVDGEVNVTFTLPTDIDGIVQVTIDGQPVYAFIYDNGTYTIPGSYAAGPHTVIVTFSDDSNYENAMGQTTFDVFKVEMVMNSTIEAATAVDDTNVTVILPEDATGHVLVYVDGDLLTSAPIVNGTAQAVVSGLDAGEHTVTAVYDGDDKYTNGTYSTTFETVKAPTNTTINATVDGFNVQIEVYVNSSVVVNGGTITLTFNGENTTADVVNGVAVFKFSDLPGKTYNITAVYSGNGQFLSSNNTGSAKVLRKASYLKPVYEPFIFNYGQLYKFRLVDKEGNPIAGRTVEFSVHSKVYYVTTDSEGWGQVQLTTEMLIHADRIFSRLIFRGDGYYKPCTYAVWFNAMQEPAKFSNVKAVKPSYKVSEKNKQITATLKDSKGKPIAGKKVSLTINGKTFKIVTNSKGVVTFSLNTMKFTNPGKIPFIVVFEDVNYKRTTAQSVLTLVKD